MREIALPYTYLQRRDELTPRMIAKMQPIIRPLLMDYFKDSRRYRAFQIRLLDEPAAIYEVFSTAVALYRRFYEKSWQLSMDPYVYHDIYQYSQNAHQVGSQLFKNWHEAVVEANEVKIIGPIPQRQYI